LRLRGGSLVSTAGTAVIETALTLPLLLVLLLNTANFGVYIYDWIALDNAARAAAEYQIYNGTVVGAPGIPTTLALEQMVCTDSLFNSTSGSAPFCNNKITVAICSNNNGTTACQGTGTAYTPVGDPEPTLFTLWSVDLKYSYTPLINSTFSLLGSQTIERQVVMRSMQ
jgi:Flp pilus assembly protein TadG